MTDPQNFYREKSCENHKIRYGICLVKAYGGFLR